jgi:hypothetical protein
MQINYQAGDIIRLIGRHGDSRPTQIQDVEGDVCLLKDARGRPVQLRMWKFKDIESCEPEQPYAEKSTSLKRALSVAVEHLADAKRPAQNWGQFLSLVEGTGAFTEDEINRWNRIYNS